MAEMFMNTKLFIEIMTDKLAEIEVFGMSGVLLTNPDVTARFPVCVVQPPLQTPRYHAAAWDLSVTCDVWADTLTRAAELFDEVKCRMAELNLITTGNIPPYIDEITRKWRFGGYFEARWNGITNTLERNV